MSLPSQGTLSVGGTVLGEDDIPMTLATGDSLVFYSPKPGFVGTERFKWIASDGTTESETATITIQVLGETSGPVAFDTVLLAAANSTGLPLPLTTSVPGSIGDWDVVILSLPIDGALVDDRSGTTIDTGDLPYRLRADSPVLYTPDPDFVGIDVINWLVSKDQEESNKATVLLVVNPAGDGSSTESLPVDGDLVPLQVDDELVDGAIEPRQMCGACGHVGMISSVALVACLPLMRQRRNRRRHR